MPRAASRRGCGGGSSARRSAARRSFWRSPRCSSQSYGRLSVTNYGFDHDHARGRRVRARVARIRRGSLGALRAARCVARVGRCRASPTWRWRITCPSSSDSIGSRRCRRPARRARRRLPEIRDDGRRSGYFRTMGIPLTAGREFESGGSAPDVIINQPLAQRQWPDGRGLGETLRIGEGRPRDHGHGDRHHGEDAHARSGSGTADAVHPDGPRTVRGRPDAGRARGRAAGNARSPAAGRGAGGRSGRLDAVGPDDAAADGRAVVAVPHGELALLDLRRASR